jgi:GR25 family glycosyltransferase involved in LPS biosynthesis
MTPPNVHVITLSETPERTRGIVDHLDGIGLRHRLIRGVNAAKWGLTTTHAYLLSGLKHDCIVEQKHVGLHLSHYMAWTMMAYSGAEEMTILEDDCRFEIGWKSDYTEARRALPDDWDILLLGSAHTQYRNKAHVGLNLWECWWPLCTHAYIVRKKALPVLIESMEMVFSPVDLALAARAYPRLNVFTILPRIAYQEGTPLDP